MTAVLYNIVAVVAVLANICHVWAYNRGSNLKASPVCSHAFPRTVLYAHHVQKKITKRMMDRRPKKSRPSDINRNNVNLHKCITKVENAPADYTVVPAADYELVREKALRFWEHGDTEAPWVEITADDQDLTGTYNITLNMNTPSKPAGGVQKRIRGLPRSGSC